MTLEVMRLTTGEMMITEIGEAENSDDIKLVNPRAIAMRAGNDGMLQVSLVAFCPVITATELVIKKSVVVWRSDEIEEKLVLQYEQMFATIVTPPKGLAFPKNGRMPN